MILLAALLSTQRTVDRVVSKIASVFTDYVDNTRLNKEATDAKFIATLLF